MKREVIVRNGVNVKTGIIGSGAGSYFDPESSMEPTILVDQQNQIRWHIRFMNSGTGEQYQYSFFGSMSIGRSAAEYAGETKLVLPADRMVSKTHCYISEYNGTLMVSDAGSRNHTWLNGRRVKQSRPLQNGDELTIGSTKLKVRYTRG